MAGDTQDHIHLFELIERMLEYDPAQRMSMKEALEHPFFDKLTEEQKNPVAYQKNENRERSHSLSR